MAATAHPARLVVLGAGGRAGQALTTTALARGFEVTALVRDPARHPELATAGVTVTAGDALDVDAVTAATAGADAVISAVTPFTAPPPSFDDFDTSFYRNVNASILTAAHANGIARIVTIGLFATLHLPDNRIVADDEHLFPPQLRPFAAAHRDGITYLQEHGDHADWLVLTPPANLSTALREPAATSSAATSPTRNERACRCPTATSRPQPSMRSNTRRDTENTSPSTEPDPPPTATHA